MENCQDAYATMDIQQTQTNVKPVLQRSCAKLLQVVKEAAYEYWRQGLNVVALKGKQPLHEWKQWQKDRQSETDFEALPWNEADGFALIGGSKLDNELFFGAIEM